jgi:hypothetical protein
VEDIVTDWTIFPLDNPSIPCGLRTDLPKKQRVHHYIPMGRDIRNGGEKGFIELEIYACEKCGHDKAKKIGQNDTSRRIPENSGTPHRDIREILLPSSSARAIQ